MERLEDGLKEKDERIKKLEAQVAGCAAPAPAPVKAVEQQEVRISAIEKVPSEPFGGEFRSCPAGKVDSGVSF